MACKTCVSVRFEKILQLGHVQDLYDLKPQFERLKEINPWPSISEKLIKIMNEKCGECLNDKNCGK